MFLSRRGGVVSRSLDRVDGTGAGSEREDRLPAQRSGAIPWLHHVRYVILRCERVITSPYHEITYYITHQVQIIEIKIIDDLYFKQILYQFCFNVYL